MIRLGFGARLALIAVMALVAIQTVAIFFYFLQRSRDTGTGLRLPVPDQTAALVELLESSPKDRWPLVLRAANSTDLRVRVSSEPVPPAETAWYEALVVDLILRRYLSALGGRPVSVRIEPSSELVSGPFEALAWASPGTVEIAAGLQTGGTLIVTTGGLLSLTMLGLPPGFWAGLLGFLVMAVTVFALRREAGPLRDLARAVDSLDPQAGIRPVPAARRAAPEIRALVAAFNRLSERIANLLEARMALIGGISHDLRTYVTRLRLRAEMIPAGGEREKAIRDLDDMTRLLDDALLAIRAVTPVREPELVDMAEVLEREAEDRRRAGAPVSLSLPDRRAQAFVLGDPVRLRRLVANLAGNAIAYGQEARLAAEVAGDTLVITVDDKGPGISPELREIVQEPFVRLEPSRNRRTGGAGLGLAIVRAAAEAHGGRFTLGDAPGGGTRARVELPRFALDGGA